MASPVQSCHRLVCRICVALFVQGHVLPSLAARWLGLPADSRQDCSRLSPIAALGSLTRIFRCSQNCFIHAIQTTAKDVGRGPIGHAGVKRMTRRKRGSIADAIDCHVGSRIRERRITLGLTRRQLGEMIDLTVPQIHKYECGFNRVSAGKLFEIACALSAPITYFFEDTGQEGPQQITLHKRMLLNVVRNVAKIRNEQQREAVRELVRALAST